LRSAKKVDSSLPSSIKMKQKDAISTSIKMKQKDAKSTMKSTMSERYETFINKSNKILSTLFCYANNSVFCSPVPCYVQAPIHQR
jgi:hypothetical protein